MVIRRIHTLLSLIAMLLISSCGYFTDEPVENSETFRNERLTGACKLEAAKFQKLLEEDITAQLDCLKENLDNFTKYVRRDNKDSISEKELRSFVVRFFPAEAEKINQSLSLLFDLNSILLNDEKSSISNRNIKRLTILLKAINKDAVEIFRIFNLLKDKKIDFWIARSEVNQAFSHLEDTIIRMIDSDVGINRLPPTLDLEEFVKKLRDLMPNSSVSDLTLDLILNAKCLVVGGDKEVLTYSEVKGFAVKLQKVLTLAFDVYYVKEENLGSKAKLYEFYSQKLNELESFFYPHPAEEKIFTQASVIETMRYHLRDNENLELYIKLANQTKLLMIDGGESSDIYTFGQIRLVAALMHMALDGMIFYEEAYPILNIGVDMTPEQKKELRVQYLKYAQELKERLDIATRDRNIFPGKMEILAYGKFLNREFDILELDETFLETVFNTKKLFSGGQKEILTWQEFQRLIERTSKIAEFYFDFATYNKDKYSKPESYKLYLDSIVSVIETLYTGELYRPILTMDDLLILAKHLMRKDDIDAFAPTLSIIKEKWIGGYGKVFTMWDVQSLLKHSQGLLEEIYFNYISYSLYEKEMASTDMIRDLEYRHHPEYGRFGAERIKELRSKFMEIATRFRFFRNKEHMILYSEKVERNVDGFVETGMFRWAFNVIASVFGHQVPEKPNQFEINIEEVDNTLYAFQPVLEYFGLWSKSMETFGRNTLLLSDLFQSLSDGNMNIGVDEFSEYAGLVLVAIKVGDEMLHTYDKYCENVGTEETPKFSVLCYRESYFKILLDDLGYKRFFPKLDKYIKSVGHDEWYTFLSSVEGFARDKVDNPMEVPMDKRNILLVLGAMMNIESTFIRYDGNRSNLLDNSELQESFKTYEKAIQLVAKLAPEQFKFTKSIFFYMVKEMKIPSKLQLATFHYRPWNGINKITAKRLNIGALLYYLVNQPQPEKQ